MKLYKISQNVNNDYDTYDSAVVVAESEEDARKIQPGGDYECWNDISWVDHPSKVDVLYLGEAESTLEKGIVIASYNAG